MARRSVHRQQSQLPLEALIVGAHSAFLAVAHELARDVSLRARSADEYPDESTPPSGRLSGCPRTSP
jgi:hypothetical protein